MAVLLAGLSAIATSAGTRDPKIYAYHASYAVRLSYAVFPNFQLKDALSTDIVRLESGLDEAELAEAPLWLGQDTPLNVQRDPPWLESEWGELKRLLQLEVNNDWQVWIDWYQARLLGRQPWPEEVEVACAMIPDEIWKQGPAVVNAEIRRIREGRASVPTPLPDAASSIDTPPTLPPQKPAAIQPEFYKEKLVLPKTPAVSRLKGRSPAASLKVLRQQLRDLADAVLGEANIDKRVPARLREIAENIPDRTPRQDVLFQIGHALEELQSYSSTATEQWPDVLSARYHAMVLAYDRTLRQFPKWTEYLTATRPALTIEQKRAASGAARQLAEALRNDEVQEQVDPALPNALDAMASTLEAKSEPDKPLDHPLALATDALVHDVLESVSNTYKAITSKALEVASRAIKKYGSEFEKGLVDEFGKQGGKHARAFVRLLFRVASSTGAFGLAMGAQQLAGFYPMYFGWLIPILAFLATGRATKPEKDPPKKERGKPK